MSDMHTELETRLTRWLTTAHHQVFNIISFNLWDFSHQCAHNLCRHIVRTQFCERAFVGATDWASCCGDDDCFWHNYPCV